MKVIVGLGNPGSSYSRTRHNVGFWVVERVGERHGLRFSSREYRSQVARGTIGEERVVLLKPQTYMNNSGEAVGRARRDLGAEPADILVVYDEVDLPLGRIRVRAEGSSGGHRGVESIVGALGSKAFPRIRIGVGRPGSEPISADYVLDKPSPEELAVLRETVERAVDAAEVWLAEGVGEAMTRFNGAKGGGAAAV